MMAVRFFIAGSPMAKLTKKLLESVPADGSTMRFTDGVYAQRHSPNSQVRIYLSARIKGQRRSTNFALGRYPDTSIEELGDLAREYRRACRSGIDPRHQVKETVSRNNLSNEVNSIALRDVVDDYIAKNSAKNKRPLKPKTKRDIASAMRNTFGHLLDRPIRSITHQDIESAIDAKAKTGREAAAKSAARYIKAILNDAESLSTGDGSFLITAQKNPANVLKRRNLNATSRDVRLSFPELRKGITAAFKHATEVNSFSMWNQHNAMLLCALMPFRPSEILSIKVSDVRRPGTETEFGPLREGHVLLNVLKQIGRASDTIQVAAPLTPVIDNIITLQLLTREIFLTQKSEVSADWRSNDWLFPSSTRMGKRLTDSGMEAIEGIWKAELGTDLAYRRANTNSSPRAFTTYWFRHTWSSQAKAMGFPASLVTDAQGKGDSTVSRSFANYDHSALEFEAAAYNYSNMYNTYAVAALEGRQTVDVMQMRSDGSLTSYQEKYRNRANKMALLLPAIHELTEATKSKGIPIKEALKEIPWLGALSAGSFIAIATMAIKIAEDGYSGLNVWSPAVTGKPPAEDDPRAEQLKEIEERLSQLKNMTTNAVGIGPDQ